MRECARLFVYFCMTGILDFTLPQKGAPVGQTEQDRIEAKNKIRKMKPRGREISRIQENDKIKTNKKTKERQKRCRRKKVICRR